MYRRVYHLGRRKRCLIMRVRAIGAIFGLSPIEHQVKLSPETRELLEALIDVDAAFHGKANKDRCLVAGKKALNQSRNTVDALIGQLQLQGFIRFERFNGGSKLVIAIKRFWLSRSLRIWKS